MARLHHQHQLIRCFLKPRHHCQTKIITSRIPTSIAAFPVRAKTDTAASDVSDGYRKRRQALTWASVAAGLIGIAGYAGYEVLRNRNTSTTSVLLAGDVVEANHIDEGLKTIALTEVEKHDSVEAGVWVTYGTYVYDVTDYVTCHPGGDQILLAAGRAVEPFWMFYPDHKRKFTQDILAQYTIGKLSLEDYGKVQATLKEEDPLRNEPERGDFFKVMRSVPFSVCTFPRLLLQSFITPNQFHFKRNHFAVPTIDPDEYELQITSEPDDERIVSVSLADLKAKFKHRTITSCVMCCGSRRSEMCKVKPTDTVGGIGDMISNANWTGVRLADVLQELGINADDPELKHVHFEGQDSGPDGEAYAASIPLATAMDPSRDVLLAWAMNGEELPRDHGYPLRVVVPGHVGARQVKWVTSIHVSGEESASQWQRRDYKMFPPSASRQATDWDTLPAIQEPPVTSAILEPENDAIINGTRGLVRVKGYAWSGGGRGIIRVDASGDGGVTWVQASLQQADQDLKRMWAWTLWEASIPIPEDPNGQMELVCKATDVSHNCQPDSFDGIWNCLGFLCNAWSRVKVKVE